MVVGVVRIGAQRASLQQRLAVVLAGTFFATVFGFAVAAASPAPTMAATPPWYSIERYYLGLVNCTRTGGWVQSDGSCKGYGTGRYSAYVAPIRHSSGMSDLVSRPYAKLMATKNICTHFYGGTPLDRMRRAGYSSIRNWGENIGCRTASYARTAVLASHLFFQSEKSTNGGHWRNMKNPAFHWVGIGVWKYGTQVRLVVDFNA